MIAPNCLEPHRLSKLVPCRIFTRRRRKNALTARPDALHLGLNTWAQMAKMNGQMNGQWIGVYTGSSQGSIIVNVDDRGGLYQGVAYLHDGNPALPGIAASFKTANKAQPFQVRTDAILPINPQTGLADLWENVKQHYQGVGISNYADVTGSWDAASLTLEWKTDTGLNGTCALPCSKA